MRSFAFFVCAALAASAAAASSPAEDSLDEVIVTATFRPQSLLDVASSITVLDDRTLRDAGQQHFQDVLNQVPNLFWAGGTSRPRFFQIRGIGEREQYEGAPNSSVGFLIDGIDFSGIGMPATLFDVDRIEVLRGPQGMRYGANALAGLISVHSRDPAEQLSFSSEAFAGDYNTYSYGGSASGPIDSLNSAWRFSVQRYKSDGFRDDTYLNRKDTDGRDELTAHAKWRWRPSADTTVDFTWLHADLDNGYDGWSIDNTRTSLADRPGKDAQKADGGAIKLRTNAGSLGTATFIATSSQSKGEYSYDEDWGNPEAWEPYVYDYFYRSTNSRRANSLEARLESAPAQAPGQIAWLAGIYGLDVRYRLNELRDGIYTDPDYPEYSGETHDDLASRFTARNVALFGEVEGWLSDRLGWSFGLRGEQRSASYNDQGMKDGEMRQTDTDDTERMVGGEATLHFDVTSDTRVFATLSRGYKAGGFNLGRAAAIRERFDPEYLWSLDVGAKGENASRSLAWEVAAFYMKREDMQVSTGVQEEGAAGGYIFITDNAAGGRNYGMESSLRWQALRSVEIGTSLGLLRTRYSGYRPTGVDLSDRDQAHSPEYQFAVHATWRSPKGWMSRVDLSANDAYYFDVPPNDQRASAYWLTNVKAGYESEHWSVHVWARNLFDKDYDIRGFYFANEPPDWEDKRYVQLGEPRTVGVTARFDW